MDIKNIIKTINKYYKKNIKNNYNEYFYDNKSEGEYILKVYTNKDIIYILFDDEEDIILEDIKKVNEIKKYLNIPQLYKYKDKENFKKINHYNKSQNILHEYYKSIIESNNKYGW